MLPSMFTGYNTRIITVIPSYGQSDSKEKMIECLPGPREPKQETFCPR